MACKAENVFAKLFHSLFRTTATKKVNKTLPTDHKKHKIKQNKLLDNY